jgi:hypothetical protein
MHHFLKFGQLAPDIRTPSLLHPHSPAPKPPSGNAIAKDQVPARLVTVAWRAFCPRTKAVNFAVKVNFLWRLKPRSSHSVYELRFRGSD